MRVIIYIFFFALLLVSCRKDIVPDMPEYNEKLVIEASIETGSPALVYLSHSVPYFGSFDYTRPDQVFVKGAEVYVTDGTTTEKLQELDPNYGYAYAGSKLLGQEGVTYSIKVNY